MVDSPFTAAVHVEVGQLDKTGTINEGMDRLGAFIADTHTFTVVTDFAPTFANPDPEWQTNVRFILGGSPAGAYEMRCPPGAAFKKLFLIQNDSGQTATIQVNTPADGATVEVLTGDSALLYSDGVDIILQVALRLGDVDYSFFAPGVPGNAQFIGQFVILRAFELPDEYVGSEAFATIAATAETVLDVKKNEINVATVTFAISGVTATFANIAAGVDSFAVGDRLALHGPATADATLANISIALKGSRT